MYKYLWTLKNRHIKGRHSITPEFEQEILGRINNWSTLTTNSEFQNILTNFKTDLVNKAFAKELKKVRNKTRADIIKILKEE